MRPRAPQIAIAVEKLLPRCDKAQGAQDKYHDLEHHGTHLLSEDVIQRPPDRPPVRAGTPGRRTEVTELLIGPVKTEKCWSGGVWE